LTDVHSLHERLSLMANELPWTGGLLYVALVVVHIN
jgi:hypothetical protein